MRFACDGQDSEDSDTFGRSVDWTVGVEYCSTFVDTEKALSDTRVDGWIHIPTATSPPTSRILTLRRLFPNKPCLIYSNERQRLVKFLRSIGEDNEGLFICMKQTEDVTEQLRDSLILQPPYYYTFTMLRQLVPDMSLVSPELHRLLMRLFLEHAFRYSIHDLLDGSDVLQHRVWKQAKAMNMSSLRSIVNATLCVRAAHFMIEAHLSPDNVAWCCDTGIESLERTCRKVLNINVSVPNSHVSVIE